MVRLNLMHKNVLQKRKHCSVKDCNSTRLCKGMCSMHYQRMFKYGTTELPVLTKQVCSVTGCACVVYARTVCAKHYRKLHLYGDATVSKLRQRAGCSVSGCDDLHYAKGYCDRHYSQIRKHGRLTPESERCKESLIGRTFGKLTVVGQVRKQRRPNTIGDLRWVCACSCGNYTEKRTSSLRSGRCKSCGCLYKDIGKQKRIYKGVPDYDARRRVIKEYKRGAKDREYVFCLTDDEFFTLTKQNCYYCGVPPSTVQKSITTTSTAFTYNGIDRVDSSKGYTLDNSVPCCKTCNRMKWTMTKQDFLSWIDRVHAWQTKKDKQ